MGGLQFLKLQNDGDDKEDSCDSVDDSSVSRMVACKAKHSISAEHMQSTITLLRERIRVRVALLHQLASLGEWNLSQIGSNWPQMGPFGANLTQFGSNSYIPALLESHHQGGQIGPKSS